MEKIINNMFDFYNEIKLLLQAKQIDVSKLTPSSTFYELAIDSLDAAVLVIELEKKTKISIPEEQLFDIKSIQDLINIFENNKPVI